MSNVNGNNERKVNESNFIEKRKSRINKNINFNRPYKGNAIKKQRLNYRQAMYNTKNRYLMYKEMEEIKRNLYNELETIEEIEGIEERIDIKLEMGYKPIEPKTSEELNPPDCGSSVQNRKIFKRKSGQG